MAFRQFFAAVFLPVVALSLYCHTHETTVGATIDGAEKSSVECPITARFCVSSYKHVSGENGSATMMEARGCGDNHVCLPFILHQSTGCLGSGYGKLCCCISDQCNDELR
ncbi:hypothetical protein PFISCL1PPCAC_1093 [Pristionchus fissidentatus]|uniref:Uncharacterized protein n=1 Tax=Pristionchus fissidentatus TaxID=1538716 RepID=A0AAV5URP2_9BILA|nr:hypothetical protein PFISCL1PPCAC_1093 [Pristionchus fissidentatus]